MAELSIARALRSGTAEGEHAVAVMISDSLETDAGCAVFRHFIESMISTIVSGSAQARGLVLVASCTPPETYFSIFRKFKVESSPCFQVMDCFSDPLGWERLISPTKMEKAYDIRDLNALMTNISDLGKGIVADQPKARYVVAIDALSFFLRHHSLAAVSRFISQLRASDFLSCIIWVTHGDLLQPRVLDSLEYLSTAVVFLEPQLEFLRGEKHNGGRFRIRQKRRNGRIREQVDEFKMENESLKFFPVETRPNEDNTNNIHKVHFRLDLSEKELEDRSKVILPFEHQGNGKDLHIYDGRKEDLVKNSGGSIHYLRDSDDEMPDSDEDPDDDLDI